MAPSDGRELIPMMLQFVLVAILISVVGSNSTCLLPSGEVVPVGTRNYIISTCAQKCHCLSANVPICDDNPCAKDKTCRQGANGQCSCISGYTGDGEYCVQNPVSLSYMGCYREQRPLRFFRVHVSGTDPERAHPVSCMKACANQNYNYAAMADGRFCFCASSSPDGALQKVDDAECDADCGNPVFKGYPCGSSTDVSVYQAPIRVDAILLTSSKPTNRVQKIFEPVNVTVNVITAADQYKVAIDYGDNSGEDEDNLIKCYTAPGKYHLAAIASDVSNLTPRQIHGITLLIQAPPRRVHAVCDEVVPADEAFVCNVTVWQGSNMRISIDWSDEIKDSFPIADPVWSSVGSGSRQTFVEDKPPLFVPAEGQHILISDQDQMFQSSGYITGVEYYATAVGDFTVQVERPSCTYCRFQDSCGQLCDPVQTASCPGQLFCPDRVTCSGQCDITGIDHPDAFSVIDQKSITITELGWGYTAFDYGELHVQAGDRIGFLLNGKGRVAMRKPSPGEQTDKVCSETTSCGPNYKDTGVKFMLRVMSAEPTRVVLYHTYTRAGLYRVIVDVTAEYLPGDTDMNITEVLVQEKISDIIIISPEYNSTGSEVLFTLEPHKGTNLTYEWHFGDSNITNTTVPQIWHRYDVYGEYNTSIRVFNLIDEVVNWTMISIEDELIGLNVTSSVSVVGEAAIFVMTLTSGSHYQCVWNWTDGSPELVTSWQPKVNTDTQSHVFTRDVVYPVGVTCRNNVSISTDVTNHTVQYEIFDIHLAPYSLGYLRSKPFNFSFILTNGTDPTCDVTFDGQSVPNWYDVSIKTGWTPPGFLIRNETGFYLVKIHCVNLVSSDTYVTNFTIDMPILDPESSTNTTIVVQSGSVAFDVTMREGTSVMVTWNFGTNSSSDPDSWTAVYQLAQLENWPRTVVDGEEVPETHQVAHYYGNPGVYNVSVIVQNNYNYTEFFHTIYVINKVENLDLMSNSPVGYINKEGVVYFGFYTADVPPVLASVDILWGDGTDLETGLDFTNELWPLTQFGPHSYKHLGAYDIWVNVSNLISWANFTTTVWVILPITNFRMAVENVYVAVGADVTLTASFEIGDKVTFDIDWGDGRTESVPRTGTTFVDVDTFKHSYVTSGTKLITVKAWNAVSSVTKMFRVMIQHPVTAQMFRVQSSAPHLYPDSVVHFSVAYDNSLVFPTDAFVKFNYGETTSGGYDVDGHVSLADLFSNGTVYSASHSYSTSGDFLITVTIFNDVSEEDFTIMAGVYEPITKAVWDPVYKPVIPLNSAWLSYDLLMNSVPDQIQKALGMSRSSLLSAVFGDSDVDNTPGTTYKFGIDVTNDGTLSAVAIELKSDNDVIVFYSGNHEPELESGDTTEILYTSSGYPILRHDPRVEPHIVIDKTDQPVQIWADKPGDYKATVIISNPFGDIRQTFTVKLHEVFAGLSIESSPTVLPGAEQVFGLSFSKTNPDGCVTFAFGDGTVTSRGTEANCRAYGVDVEKAPVVDVISASIHARHVYRKEGVYSQIVTAYSPTQNLTDTAKLVVSRYSCQTPKLRLLVPNTSVLDPLPVPKRDPVQLAAHTTIDCDDVSNKKLWSVVEVDENTGDEVAEVDLSSFPSRFNSELDIKAGHLDYGLYKVYYKVVMMASDWFSDEVSAYLRVVKSNLTARFIPGLDTAATRSWNATITLDAEKYSIDPDDPDGKQHFDGYTWLCRQQYETLSWDPDRRVYTDTNRSVILSYKSIEYALRNDITLPNHGGCFHQGPGFVANKDMSLYDRGALTFTALNLFKTETYLAVAMVQKDTRRAVGSAYISIVEGDPPQLAISCIVPRLCTWNSEGAIAVNPSNHLRLVLDCKGSGITSCDELEIAWVMLYSGPHSSWKIMPRLNESSIVLSSSKIVIFKEVFIKAYDEYRNMTSFKLLARARRKSGDNTTGSSEVLIRVHPPIVAGNCDVTSVPNSLLNERRISCYGFYHESGIQKYKAFVKYPGDDGAVFLQSSFEESFLVSLPLGRRSDNSTLELWLRVIDNNGGFIRKLIANETLPSPPDDGRSYDDVMTTVTLIAAEANSEMSTSFFMSLSTLLNQDAEESSRYHNCKTAARYMSESYKKHEDLPDGQNYLESEQEECIAHYEKDRNLRSQLRDVMVAGLMNLTASSLDSLEEVSSTLSEVLARPEEISRQSQESVSEYFTKMTDDLERIAMMTPLEQIAPTLSPLIKIMGCVLMSSNSLWMFPLESDIESARRSQYYYYNTFYGSDRAALVDYDFEEALDTLQMETNEIVQRDHSSGKTVNAFMSNLDRLISVILRGTNPGEAPLITSTEWFSMMIQKDVVTSFTGSRQSVEDVSVDIPDYCHLINETTGCDPDQVVGSFQMSVAPFNVYGFLKDKPPALAPHLRSSTLSLSVHKEDGSPLAVDGSSQEITVNLPVKVSMDDLSTANYVRAVMSPTNQDVDLFYHVISLTNQVGSLNVEVVPEDPDVQLAVYIRYDDFPDIRPGEWDVFGVVPRKLSLLATRANYAEDKWLRDVYTVTVPTEVYRGRTGKWIVGIRQLEDEQRDRYGADHPLATVAPLTGRLTTNYSIRCWSATCAYLEAGSWQRNADPEWLSAGLAVGLNTTYLTTQCLSSHLSMFTGGWAVKPNPIDFDYVFSNMDFAKNPTIYTAQILVLVAYVIGAVWARRKDRKDVEKLGVTPLSDNCPDEKYYYVLSVQTGIRKEAGTRSKVYFILAGDYEETDVRVLDDPKRPALKRGALNTFLMATARPLGKLSYIRIWHDNSGKGSHASWYLNYIIVHDLQTKEHFYFIVNDWFAVDRSDGKVDRLVPVAGRHQMINLKNLVTNKAAQKLGDDHLWFSVIARPPESRFTRLQRLSCCLLLLYTTMLANAMYYEILDSSDAKGGGISFGPFSFSMEQLFVGIVSVAVVFPVNFVVVMFFRKSRPRTRRPPRYRQAIDQNEENMKQKRGQSSAKGSPSARQDPEGLCQSNDVTESDRDGGPTREEADGFGATDRRKKAFHFPWWCRVVAWIVLWLSTLVSAAFVTFYGISFGDEKTRKWITSLIVSFFTSIFLTQPIKVLLVAVLFSLIFKKAELVSEDEDEELVSLEADEEFIYPSPYGADTNSRRRNITYKPPNPDVLEKSRQEREKEKKMFEALREVIFHLLFVFVLFVVSYGFRNPNAFLLKNGLAQTVVGYQYSFNDISSMSKFWDWVEYTLGPAVRADKWYNGRVPVGQRGFMNDRVSRTMGYAVIRQLRVKPGTCHVVPKVSDHIHDCFGAYSVMSEDKSSYNFGWSPASDNATEQTVWPEFVYRTASELNGWPYIAKYAVYGGGGYVAELKGSEKDVKRQLARLKDGLWLDRRTRAVFVEFTAYNPNVNLFGILTMVVEFCRTSYVDKSFRVEPMNLLPSASGANVLDLGAQVAFVAFLVWFLVREIRKAVSMKRAYLWNVWNYNEVAVIVLGVGSVVVYIYRMVLAKVKTTFFKQTHGDGYMKFQYIAYWNELLLYMVGWLCFFSTVKFLRLLRFNKKMGLLGSVLAVSARPLLGYAVMFSIWLMAFCQAFYLKFVESDENFSTITGALESLLLMLVGKITNFHEMLGLKQTLGVSLFIAYIVVICYIMFEMFMAILGGAIDEVRADVGKQSNEFEIIDYMYARFVSWMGLDGLLRRLAGGRTSTRQAQCATAAEMNAVGGRLSPETVDQLIRNLNASLDKLMEHVETQQKYGGFERAFLVSPRDGNKLRAKEGKVMTSDGKPER